MLENSQKLAKLIIYTFNAIFMIIGIAALVISMLILNESKTKRVFVIADVACGLSIIGSALVISGFVGLSVLYIKGRPILKIHVSSALIGLVTIAKFVWHIAAIYNMTEMQTTMNISVVNVK